MLRQRYRQAGKQDKGRILDEFVAVVGCHRKHAIRLLTADPAAAAEAPVVARRTFDEAVRQALIVLWETIDRLLASVRKATPGRKKRRAKSISSKEIPVRTFADYGDAQPGFLEIDFVSHGGTSMQGVFLWSLVATDVSSGWTEAVALVAREQSLVVEVLEVLRR